MGGWKQVQVQWVGLDLVGGAWGLRSRWGLGEGARKAASGLCPEPCCVLLTEGESPPSAAPSSFWKTPWDVPQFKG